MAFVFISYARENMKEASRLAKQLRKRGMDVFQDVSLQFGDDLRVVIQERLEQASCVVVLWSRYSALSHWVCYEANEALARRTLIEVRLDKSKPPPPFGALLQANLVGLDAASRERQIIKLLDSIEERLLSVEPLKSLMSLAAPRNNQSVTDAHITLIHTCWRAKEYDEEFGGAKMYRWELALFGSRQALDRVKSVSYFLHPAYENTERESFARYELVAKTHRKVCFRLPQLANGHSMARAIVHVKGQLKVVRLSRYLNLFDAPNRIDDYFV